MYLPCKLWSRRALVSVLLEISEVSFITVANQEQGMVERVAAANSADNPSQASSVLRLATWPGALGGSNVATTCTAL